MKEPNIKRPIAVNMICIFMLLSLVYSVIVQISMIGFILVVDNFLISSAPELEYGLFASVFVPILELVFISFLGLIIKFAALVSLFKMMKVTVKIWLAYLIYRILDGVIIILKGYDLDFVLGTVIPIIIIQSTIYFYLRSLDKQGELNDRSFFDLYKNR